MSRLHEAERARDEALRELARILARASLTDDDREQASDLLLSAGFPEQTEDDTRLLDRVAGAPRALPAGFREGHSGDLACRHRDVSCCSACADAHPEIVDVYGQHFWVADPGERAALRLSMRRQPSSGAGAR